MPRATLTVRVPEEVWVGELSRSHPEVTLRVLTAVADDDRGVAVVELEGPDAEAEALLDELAAADAVTEVERFRRPSGPPLVQFETTRPLLLGVALEAGTPLELPFEVQDGRVAWEVTASRDRLSALGEGLRDLGLSFEVEAVREAVPAEPLLTERQRSLAETAVELGYYDTPREATLTEVAEAAGVAKSTASETLHRAESAVVREVVGDSDGG